MSSTITIVNFSGFETGSSDEAAAVGASGVTYSTTTKRTGGYALKCAGTGLITPFYRLMAHATTDGNKATLINTSDVYVTVYMNIETAPGVNPETVMAVRNTEGVIKVKADLRLTTARKLNLYDYTGTLQASGTTVLSTGRWYRIELRIGTESSGAANDAPYELKIDGISEFSGTNGNFAQYTAGDVSVGCQAIHNIGSWTIYFDDFTIASNGFVGASQVTMPTVSGNGAYTGWTGTYTAVDETPPNGDTDYVNSSSVGTEESVTSTALSTYGFNSRAVIHAVKAVAITRKVSGTSGIRYSSYINPSTDYTSADHNPATTYELRGKVHNIDFNSGADWDLIGADALQPGVKQNTTADTRCTVLRKFILWTPGPGGWKSWPHAGI